MAETSSTPDGHGGDGELAALDDLADQIEDRARDSHLLARRVRRLRDSRAGGRSWQDVLARDSQPATLHLSARVLRGMTEASGVLRRTLARGLRADGATVPEIAERFGVSHQRISTLLRRREPEAQDRGPASTIPPRMHPQRIS